MSEIMNIKLKGARRERFLELYAELAGKLPFKLNYNDVIDILINFYNFCRDHEDCSRYLDEFLANLVEEKSKKLKRTWREEDLEAEELIE